MQDIIKKAEENIIKYGMIEKGDNVIIGVSGGFDSMALLDILFRLKDKYGFNITVAHVNHGVRGAEADSDEKYVENRAREYGLEYKSESVDMNGYAEKHRISAEEAGRKLRYRFFNSIEKEKNYKIAVAHNRNDQAETLLMRIMRGTGADGLSGIQYKSGRVIRPLLSVSRDEIEKYCSEENLNPRTDSTNLKPIYARNKIRLELIPYIEENFSENIVDSLFRLSENMKRDTELLKKISEDTAERLIVRKKKNRIEIDNNEFRKLDESLKARVLRDIIERVKGNLVGIEEVHINSAIELSNKDKTGKSVDITGEIRIKIDYDKLSVEKCENNLEVRYNYKIAVNQKMEIPEINSELSFAVKDIKEVNMEKNNSNIEYFDYEKINGDIYVRNRRNGDKVSLFGMKGRKKLKDYFIDEKIEREKRERIPLIVFGDEIAWVAGYRRSNLAPVDRNTEKVLEIRISDL